MYYAKVEKLFHMDKENWPLQCIYYILNSFQSLLNFSLQCTHTPRKITADFVWNRFVRPVHWKHILCPQSTSHNHDNNNFLPAIPGFGSSAFLLLIIIVICYCIWHAYIFCFHRALHYIIHNPKSFMVKAASERETHGKTRRVRKSCDTHIRE